MLHLDNTSYENCASNANTSLFLDIVYDIAALSGDSNLHEFYMQRQVPRMRFRKLGYQDNCELMFFYQAYFDIYSSKCEMLMEHADDCDLDPTTQQDYNHIKKIWSFRFIDEGKGKVNDIFADSIK